MTKHHWLTVAMLAVVACGDHKAVTETHDDAATRDDAALSATTDVVGSLGGQNFHLHYAAVKRGGATDPIWVCAADVPVTYADCDNSMGPNRMMFLGPFIYDSSDIPRWGIPQVWLYRVGPSPLSAWAKSGSLSVQRDDAVGGVLQLTLSVDFGEAAPTTGAVAIGI